MSLIEIILTVAAGVLVFSLIRKALIARRTTPIDPDSAEWLEAMLKAKTSLSTAKSLFKENPGTVLVKFPITNARGDREHVWGELLEVTDDTFTATMENSLVEGSPENDPPYTMNHDLLEDWVLFQADGTIRGGFTIQAEIAMARAQGKRPAGQAAEFEGKFIDS